MRDRKRTDNTSLGSCGAQEDILKPEQPLSDKKEATSGARILKVSDFARVPRSRRIRMCYGHDEESKKR